MRLGRKGASLQFPEDLPKNPRQCCYQPGHGKVLQFRDSSSHFPHSLFYVPPSPYGSLSSFTYGSVRFKNSSGGNYEGIYEGTYEGTYEGSYEGIYKGTYNGYDDCSNSGRARSSAGQYSTVRSCQ